jgi:hypothetical protein
VTEVQLILGVGALALPLMLLCPGLGFAKWLRKDGEQSLLQWILDAIWIGLALNWIDVALVRELDINPNSHPIALITLAAGWTALGAWMARAKPRLTATSPNERIGLAAVALAVLFLGLWKAADIQRPLHGHWYLDGAGEAEFEGMAPILDETLAQPHPIEGSDHGAFSFKPSPGGDDLVASTAARGQIAIAMQGPVGSVLAVGSQRAVVSTSVTEVPEEGAVRRYLSDGVAGLLVETDLGVGDGFSIHAGGNRVFVLPGAESVWAAHANGSLRYIHYYQLLNQVENQVWAQEMLQDRWATLNQPPGWSPLLTIATVLIIDDMQAAAILFLWVLVLVGASAVRLASVLAPQAPRLAFLVPGAMVLCHGLLMFEPGSYNFPDSLFAAAIVAVSTAIAERRAGWIAGLGIAAGLSRWPGVFLSTLLLLAHWRAFGALQSKALKRLWTWVFVGAVLAAIGAAAGVLDDLLFILYFETFPEHWHGEYAATRLTPRIPGFFALWAAYTGGGLLLAAATALRAVPSPSRSGLRWLIGSIGGYSLLLCTIDHHPTHYFLPLVAVTGVAVVCASDAVQHSVTRMAIPLLCLIGVFIFLWRGDVGLQPIEDMVFFIDEFLNQPA